VLLQRDPTMTVQSISQHMHRKLPHHTIRSWAAFISNNARELIDKTRKKHSIAHRKAQTTKKCKPEPQEPENLLLGLPGPSGERPSIQALEEDIETVAKFFVTGGGGENLSEAEQWACLASQSQCQTAGNWEDFYSLHSGRVTERYQELVEVLYPSLN